MANPAKFFEQRKNLAVLVSDAVPIYPDTANRRRIAKAKGMEPEELTDDVHIVAEGEPPEEETKEEPQEEEKKKEEAPEATWKPESCLYLTDSAQGHLSLDRYRMTRVFLPQGMTSIVAPRMTSIVQVADTSMH